MAQSFHFMEAHYKNYKYRPEMAALLFTEAEAESRQPLDARSEWGIIPPPLLPP